MMPHLAATYAEVKVELRQYLRNTLDGKGRSRQRQLESQRSIDDESDTDPCSCANIVYILK